MRNSERLFTLTFDLRRPADGGKLLILTFNEPVVVEHGWILLFLLEEQREGKPDQIRSSSALGSFRDPCSDARSLSEELLDLLADMLQM